MNRLAFSTLGCPDWSLEQALDAARRYGYDGLELRLLDGQIVEPSLPREERERVARLFAESELPLCCLDSSIRVATGAEPDAVERDLRAFLQLAHDLRAPLVRVFSGEWPAGWAPERVFDTAADLLNRVTPEAERLDVALVLETHDAAASAKSVAEILRRVPSPAFGALWDTHHPYRMGESPDEVLDLLGARLLHVHVKDARRDEAAANGWQLVLLGEGEVPVRESLAALKRRGYDGWVSVEWEKKWHPEIPGPEVAMPQHEKLLRQWLGE